MFNTLQYVRKSDAEGDLVTKNDLKTELKDFENRLLLKLGAMMATMLTISTGITAIVMNFIVKS